MWVLLAAIKIVLVGTAKPRYYTRHHVKVVQTAAQIRQFERKDGITGIYPTSDVN